MAEALRRDVETLANDIGERNSRDRPALERASSFVRERFTQVGYSVEEQPFEVRGKRYVNLEVELPGTSRPKEIVVVGAHYDTAEGTPGADDNASGVAVLFFLAERMRQQPAERTVRFVAFANEEPPFFNTADMGSQRYAEAVTKESHVVAMLSLETVGFYSDEDGSQNYPFPFSLIYPSTGDFLGFVGDSSSSDLVTEVVGSFRKHARFPSEGVAAPADIPGIDWSDHGPFARLGVPAVMVTDTALFRNPHDHRATDVPERLDYERMAWISLALVGVVKDVASVE